MTKPRVLVFAYHDVGYECLEALLARGVKVVAVITHENDPKERVWFRSVADLARSRNLPTYTPANVNDDEWFERLRELRPDLILSFYYRHMIGERILALARLGAYNMHGSLLPKYRGRAPINWAVLNGETETGATLHVMVKRPDAGDIVDQERVAIGPLDTAHLVFGKVTAAARLVLIRQLDNLLAGRAPRQPQDEGQASYFGGRRPEDGRIDWRRDAGDVFNLVRALTHPFPGAFSDVGGRRFFIWWAQPRPGGGGEPGEVLSADPLVIACGRDSLQVVAWQWCDAESRRNGAHGLPAGAVLGAFPAPIQKGVRA